GQEADGAGARCGRRMAIRTPKPPRASASTRALWLRHFNRGSGGRPGSRHRQQLNGEFIAALLRDFRHGGPKAIERVRRTQPAAYLEILALLVPREHKVEHRNLIKELSDEQLEAMIEFIETSLAAQAGGPAKVIEGTIEPISVEVQRGPLLDSPKPKNRVMLEADTAVGPRGRI